jgi:large-conductance mechanosensitive channel
MMNFIQLALAFAVGIAALWIVNSIFQSIMNKKIGIAEHNTATATFQAGIPIFFKIKYPNNDRVSQSPLRL